MTMTATIDPTTSGTHDTLDGLDSEAFPAAFRHHAAGVAVITADSGAGPAGLTATSVFSVSADPALLVFSISAVSSSAPTIASADTVVVHLLGIEQLDIAQLCATSGVDRFADPSIWDRLATGEPFFPAAATWIRGRIVNRMVAGASTVVAVHALEAGQGDHSASPLVYHDRSWHGLGQHSALDV
ncbi:flavin reductase (DIM6/NTAB) family NADH-FMN oxidoreductase RutF [Salinibacterium sp. CAN_S4]|uniref:flavin reductase family protein n=1 Tax=Salinibacterium sp. CAN_S4 TaxID=2787727 RepID=UPI001A32032F